MPMREIDGSVYAEIAVVNTPDKPLQVDIGGTSINVNIDEVEINNDTGNPISIANADPARTPTTASIAGSITSVTLLAANANRKGFSISNVSGASLYLSFSDPATTANCFVQMPPGAFLLLDQQLMVANAIYGIWSAANGTAQVTEYV